MEQVRIVGVDLAKRVFQVHGAAADGAVVFRKKLTRAQFLAFLGKLPAVTAHPPLKRFGAAEGHPSG